jgi:hypothetical protein
MPSLALATTSVTFRNNLNELIDPLVVTVRYRSQESDWVTKTYPDDITRNSQGNYSYEVPCDRYGDWYVEWYCETAQLSKTIKTGFQVPQ